ncbi:PREDICTED: F-box protein At5g42460-like [Camelina sativa]|uniref:F-box protein At5g42460-like n=1 Tax=Camelina sativa TaxID=90675 RepID=A0ABM1R034_CAMSA|nr:PREDICTED: F-box protein At5g42460-like [Camelina sativa]
MSKHKRRDTTRLKRVTKVDEDSRRADISSILRAMSLGSKNTIIPFSLERDIYGLFPGPGPFVGVGSTPNKLSRDLVEEVLVRVPFTSLRAVRLTCKNWNDVCKDGSFIKKHIVEAKKKQVNEFEIIIMMNYKIYLMSVDLHSNVDPSITLKGTLFSLKDEANHHQVDYIIRVFHCDGVLLCITKDLKSSLVVWDPYSGQTRWIQPRDRYHDLDKYALGHDEKKKYKIFRFVDYSYAYRVEERICELELYSFESDSWKVVLTVPPEWEIDYYHRGVSLKGNTYWHATNKVQRKGRYDVFLICFDFTTERFGPPLPLPFNTCCMDDIVTLSSAGEDQLAVLFQDGLTSAMEIWVTSKIEPTEVSWNKLFLADYKGPVIGTDILTTNDRSFFIDVKNNVAVVLDRGASSCARYIAYIIGNNEYFEKVDLGESADPNCCPLVDLGDPNCCPLVCSYVPSTVQIRQL